MVNVYFLLVLESEGLRPVYLPGPQMLPSYHVLTLRTVRATLVCVCVCVCAHARTCTPACV